MNLLQRYQQTIKDKNLFSLKDKLLLAVSGGVDSVVLCELCRQAGFDFVMAHCNFQLREEESDRDEKFVRELGEKYKVKVEVRRFDTERYAADNHLSIQEAARALRYEWFEELLNNELTKENTAVSQEIILHSPFTIHLLTAHHRDDNIETVLMNFFRGTGLHGLTGIPVSYGHIKRPLLDFSKVELLQFAKENNLAFIEDSSNFSSKYTRNFFRNEILPAIRKVYPMVNDNLHDNISRFKEIEKLYQLSVEQVKKKLVREKGSEWHIPVKQLLAYKNKALIYEIISRFGFREKQIDEVLKLASSDSGHFIDSPGLNYRIIKHRHWFIISPVQSVEAANIVIEEKDKTVGYEQGILHFEKIHSLQPTANKQTAFLDSKEIVFPLLLRKWKTGDYFYPLGMKNLPAGRQGKKKLSRFFIDEKLSKTQKENVWVIESNKRIIWVVGHRIDERFRLTENTKAVFKITLES